MNKIVLFLAMLIVLPACHRKSKIVSAPAFSAKEIEARFYDVPFFIHSTMERASVSEAQPTLVVFEAHSTIDYVLTFYQQEMEWFGWECKALVHDGDEALLSFEKPNKFCLISIRLRELNRVKIVIGTGLKK